MAWLKADPTIAGLVDTRVYAVNQPQANILPQVVYKVISGVGVHGLTGAARQRTSRVRVTARADVFADAVAIRESVRKLDGFIGDLQGLTVHYIAFSDAGDAWVEPPDGSDEGTYERPCDLEIKYHEPAPAP